MRVLLLVVWLLVPVGAVAYHYGPGQSKLKLDQVSELIRNANQLSETKDWTAAQKEFEKALGLLPDDQTEMRRELRLEICKIQVENKQLPTAREDLSSLVSEVEADSNCNPQFVADARSALASSQYYMTWLMRLEGQPREKWEPEIDAAQQNYRLLAEQANNNGDQPTLKIRQEDLESAVRLARMDLGELQGLPLPSQ